MSRLHAAALLGAALLAGVAPLFARGGAGEPPASGFPGWPTHYDGRPLQPLPLGERESLFARDFPGRIGRFSDGRREIIIRWTRAPTRRLHSAADCFRGIGYAVTPKPIRLGGDGLPMGCFRATRGTDGLDVCESIRDEHHNGWSDVSAWYWAALLRSDGPPWWSFVIAERPARSEP